MEELVLYFSLKYEGDFQSIYNALMRKEQVDEKLRCELKKKLKSQYTTLFSHDYPEQLKLINCPPFVLYYYGDLSLVKEKCIGVVATLIHHRVSDFLLDSNTLFLSPKQQSFYHSY